MKSIVNITSVSKSFRTVKALTDISLEVQEGQLFGLIGPDGAGKTTLFRIMNTLMIPDSGSATVLDMNVVDDYRQIRPQLGYMPGRFSLYQDLTVEENIRFFASVFGTTLEENYDLVKPIYSQLEPFKNRLAGDLSGGMKQKLALSCALIHKPRLLLLDEPTTGVDAVSRQEFWEMLESLKKGGITMIVSTPYMDEARLCDQVALMQEGKILQIDTPANIVKSFEKLLFGIKSSRKYKLLRVLHNYEWTHSAHPFGEYIHYTDKRNDPDPASLLEYLSKQGLTDAEIKPVRPNIEDSFMELMNRESEAAHE